jgi:aryl-alcohol dehydrogenase-like predicted oxidoreductase
MEMQQRRLGKDGPMVSAVGLGCWSFAGAYGPASIEESHATLAAALDLGVTHLDTSNRYGDGISEEIIGAFIKRHPGRFSIATKGGIINRPVRRFDNSPEHLRSEIEGSLRRLGVEYVDLYYVHRREQDRPIEEVVETLVGFKKEGKIGGFGFSEIAPFSLMRAAAVHPVRAVQNEYSLWTRQVELGLLQACDRLGTTFVAFSPLGRGMFADRAPDPQDFHASDFRRGNPRFNPPHFEANRQAVAAFRRLAKEMGHAPAALAIAWVLARGEHVIPIPGTRSAAHLKQNAAGAAIRLSDADLKAIEAVLPAGFAHGPRYSEQQFAGVEQYC